MSSSSELNLTPWRAKRGRRPKHHLRAVGVGPGIGHRESPKAIVAQVKVFIFKLVPIDASAPGAIAVSKVPALAHKPLPSELKFSDWFIVQNGLGSQAIKE